jgi:hypothetical protein
VTSPFDREINDKTGAFYAPFFAKKTFYILLKRLYTNSVNKWKGELNVKKSNFMRSDFVIV